MRALRSDVFYFCAVCTQTTHDQQIRDNAQLLQTMIENLHKCCLNLSSFKNQHSRELAILKSKRRQICRSPNHIQMQDTYEPSPPSVQSTAVQPQIQKSSYQMAQTATPQHEVSAKNENTLDAHVLQE